MEDVTQILNAIESGRSQATAELLPVVYRELKRIAALQMASERANHTLNATALVHEVYVRLVDQSKPPHWRSRGQFFAAAAEAMRRILVENARRKQTLKRGGHLGADSGDVLDIAAPELSEDLMALDEALTRLSEHDANAAKLVNLRYFSGLTVAQAAEALEMSPRSADRLWVYAKAWLHRELRQPSASE